jgi:putative peptidoglycan lipid II flippase
MSDHNQQIAAELPPPVTDERQNALHDQDATNATVAGATGILALGNIASRILGLAREKTLAYLFGASAQIDAFRIAVIVPQTFYDLLIGGHVNGAIVPVFSEIVTIKGRDELWKLVSVLFSVLLIVISALVLLIQIFAPYLVSLPGGGYDQHTLSLATDLLRLTSPALIFLGLFALFSGTLYALRSFRWPAFAGVVFNACIVIAALMLVPPLELSIRPGISYLVPVTFARPDHAVTAAALGWTFGALIQMLLQGFGLRTSKLSITFNWRHPALRRIALLYTPVMFSLIMDTVVIRFFSYNLATHTGIAGSIQYMNLATTLIQFPQGLVATAISVAILPMLASQAAVITTVGMQAFRDTLGLGLRLAITLMIPASVGLFILATPITTLLFQGGEFTPADTVITVHALRLYLIGLPFAAVDLLLVYAFYARKDTFTPAMIGLFSHLVYIATVLILFDRFSLYSLMIADSVKHIVHATVSALLLHRKIEGYGQQHLIGTVAKTLLASVVMAAAGWISLPFLMERIGLDGTLHQLVFVLLSGGLCVLTFMVIAALLKIEELRWIASLIRRRILPA